ncbi:hypothetical protein B0J11DRAFT_529996 [Dendryphion nanum]|uniref:Uncharacterized protein n=1 Tax=Dendryphion nanum TaxID=256645 RepID=A0A9P9DQG0_9PLEO|nr:hypothetical protein B0J11DRAFT_529996 [Dendryphion nanum]
MEVPRPLDRPYRPQGFRPNFFQPSSPPRVSTDPERSSKKPHLHGLHHHHRHHHRRSRHAKEAVQSAIQLQPPTSFGNLLKQASRSKNNSPSRSRRESNARSNGEQEGDVKTEPPRPVRPDDIERERARAKAREREVQASLQALTEQSLKTSRRLDDTYYSILEKLSTLRQTIGSLQELYGLTKELHDNFETDTRELVDEVQGQVNGFGNFDAQQRQVQELEERIACGKQKADLLTARLDEAKKRVELQATLETEGEARTTRRLRVIWGTIGVLVGLILITILFHQLKPMHSPHHQPSLDFKSRDLLFDLEDAPIPLSAKEAIIGPLSAQPTQIVEAPPLATSTLADDPGLHMFDEL